MPTFVIDVRGPYCEDHAEGGQRLLYGPYGNATEAEEAIEIHDTFFGDLERDLWKEFSRDPEWCGCTMLTSTTQVTQLFGFEMYINRPIDTFCTEEECQHA